MNANLMHELEEHLLTVNKDLNLVIERNENLMMKCQNFNDALPYLETHYDLVSLKTLNNHYVEDINFTPSERAESV